MHGYNLQGKICGLLTERELKMVGYWPISRKNMKISNNYNEPSFLAGAPVVTDELLESQ